MITLEKNLLQAQKALFEEQLLASIETLSPKNGLRDAVAYSLLNGGKRFRPIVVQSIANSLEFGPHVYYAALAVEYFHTASLIADDLPCMDNDDTRREKPSLHKATNETTALLASYGLISEAFQKIFQACDFLKHSNLSYAGHSDAICAIALDVASKSSGMNGATLGQYYDLFPLNASLNHLKDIIHLKTITLFDVAFTFGWIFGGGNLEKLSDINRLAFHFGLAFQIADDLKDFNEDFQRQCVSNISVQIGKKASISLLEQELKAFSDIKNNLNLHCEELDVMKRLLQSYAFKES